MDKIFAELKEIRALLTSRPTWAVSSFVTLLCSLVVGLIVYVVTKGR